MSDLEKEKQRWETQTLNPLIEKYPERKAEFYTSSQIPLPGWLFLPNTLIIWKNWASRVNTPSPAAFSHHVPRALVDDAAICRLCHRRGIQSALSLFTCPRPNRPFGCF